MERRILARLLAILALAITIGGCAPRTARRSTPSQRVAGSEERQGPTTVTVRFTQNGITISPSTIPQGDITVRVVNNSGRTVTFTMLGSQGTAHTSTLRNGATTMMRIRNPRPSTYTYTPSR